MGDRGQKATFIEYASQRKSDKLWDGNAQKVVVSRDALFAGKALNSENCTNQSTGKIIECLELKVSDGKQRCDRSDFCSTEDAETELGAEPTHVIEHPNAQGESFVGSDVVAADSPIQKSSPTRRTPEEWWKSHSVSIAEVSNELLSFCHGNEGGGGE